MPATKRRTSPFGRLVRQRRNDLEMSQEALADRAGVSVRHLSCVETGKSFPSKEVVAALAGALQFENTGLFLEAAGYVAPYSTSDADTPHMKKLAKGLADLVHSQLHPALLHDRFGTVLHYNELLAWAVQLFTGSPPTAELSSGHALLAQIRPFVKNWEEIAALYRGRLFHELVRGGDDDLTDDILEQLYQQLEASAEANTAGPSPWTPLLLARGSLNMTFRLVTLTVGAPQDIEFRNYRLAMFMPADDMTARRIDERLAATID